MVDKYLKPASDAGLIPAMYDYSKTLDSDKFVEEFRLLSVSAGRSFPYSLVSLGWIYLKGEGSVAVDYEKAFSLNSLAATLLNGEGASNLGYIFENGPGVPKSLVKAAEWYGKAIRMPGAWSGQAELRLGILYATGAGVGVDVAKARSLYSEALAKKTISDESRMELQYRLANLDNPSSFSALNPPKGTANESYFSLAARGELRKGEDYSSLVSLPVGRSVVFRGTCDADCSDLDLVVSDEAGRILGSDVASNATPAVAVQTVGTKSASVNLRVKMEKCGVSKCAYQIYLFKR